MYGTVSLQTRVDQGWPFWEESPGVMGSGIIPMKTAGPVALPIKRF